MNRRPFLQRIGLLVAASLVETACQYLPAITAGLITAQSVAASLLSVVDAIDSFVASYFQQHPDPAKQATVTKALARTKQVIGLLSDVLSTAKDATSLDVQAAIQDAQKAYADLLALTQPLGVTSDKRVSKATLDGDVLMVPPPEHFAVSR